VPFAPSGFNGLAQGTDRIYWTWTDNSTNEDKFIILSDTIGVIVDNLPPNTTGYLEAGLLPNTTYTRCVQAYNSSGYADSNMKTVCTLANPPTGLSVTFAAGTTVAFSWTAGAGGAAAFRVERKEEGGSWMVLEGFADGYTSTSYTDVGVVSDTTYYYRIAAFNFDGIMTSYDGPVMAKTLDITAPSSAINVSASIADIRGGVTLSWTNPGDDGTVGNIAGGAVLIKYSKDGSTTYDTAIGPVTISKYLIQGATEQTTITGLDAGTLYYFFVKVRDDAGNLSAEVKVSTYTGAQPYLKVYGITSPITAGDSSDITVEVIGPLGTTDTDYTGTVSFRCYLSTSQTLSGATLPADYTFTTMDSGIHTFSNAVKFPDRSEVYTCYVKATDKNDSTIYGEQTVIVSPLDFISGTVTQKDGTPIALVYVEAYGVGNSTITDTTLTDGTYELTGLEVGTYTVKVAWEVDGIESSAEKQTYNGTANFDFTLEINYTLATVQGFISGLKAAKLAPSGIKALSTEEKPSYAFVEIQKKKAVMRIPVKQDGSFQIENLLPGNYVIRAFDGEKYSRSANVKVLDGETLDVKFTWPLNVKKVYAQPNPCRTDTVDIRFLGSQTYQANVKIYTITGEEVRKSNDFEDFPNANSETGRRFVWDLKNNDGKQVANGVYFYIMEIKDPASGEKKVFKGKLAVIK